MEQPVVPLQVAAEHYRDAMRRGHNYGKTEFKLKAVELLSQLAADSPFDEQTLRGIKIAMRAVKDMSLD
jgi:hypothetical protein